MSKRISSTLIALAVGAVLTVIFAAIRGIFVATSTEDALKFLCDGLFVTATLLGMSGIIRICGNYGTFDMLGYGVKKLGASIFMRRDRFEEQNKTTYNDYREKRQQNPRPAFHLLVSSAIFLAMAVIVLVVYYSIIS